MLFGLMVLAAPLLAEPPTGAAKDPRWQKRWIYMCSNLYVNENLPKIEAILKRGKAVGYNGLLFADYKTGTWWKLSHAARWKANAGKLRKMTRDLGMELCPAVFPFGYAGPFLFHDVNLASGTPIRDAPLVARKGLLVPVQTAEIPNGSFEKYRGQTAMGFRFQDAPGERSFLDTEVAKEGKVSLRFEELGKSSRHRNGRICLEISVQPWQQYRLRIWMKADRLTGGYPQLLVLADGHTIQYQHLSATDGKRRYHVKGLRGLTMDWLEQSVTFNSLNHSKVMLYVGIWGGQTGKVWWDDWRIDSVPTLNLIRRDTLPLSIVGQDGTEYEEGRDFGRIADPKLGRMRWPGTFDTFHEPPAIRLTANSRIEEGQKVLLSGYHASLVYNSQVNCSMNDPKCFELCNTQIEKAEESLAPDGYFMSHEEIRSGGWEPPQVESFKTSGELFAYNIKRCFEIANEKGGAKPVYVWSDMYDPSHNARKKYYLVNSTLEGSWEGLDPRIIIMKWGGGKIARPGLEFFAARGHKQMIAGYYDGDVAANHKMWLEAAKEVPDVIGTMYTTWVDKYDDLEKFAEVWWGGQGD